MGESFIEESPNKHALRSRLCFELDSTLKAVVEPMQSAVANCPGNYDSAMLTGDIDSAMLSHVAHCIGSLHIGLELGTLSKSFVACIKQSVRMPHEHSGPTIVVFTPRNVSSHDFFCSLPD